MDEKKSLGRPKKKNAERRDKAILVRVTETERQAIKAKAPYAVGRWIRDTMLAKTSGPKF